MRKSCFLLCELNHFETVVMILTIRELAYRCLVFEGGFREQLMVGSLYSSCLVGLEEADGMNYSCDFLFVDLALTLLGLGEGKVRRGVSMPILRTLELLGIDVGLARVLAHRTIFYYY